MTDISYATSIQIGPGVCVCVYVWGGWEEGEETPLPSNMPT
jgi:hypothetical protein